MNQPPLRVENGRRMVSKSQTFIQPHRNNDKHVTTGSTQNGAIILYRLLLAVYLTLLSNDSFISKTEAESA